MATRVSCRISNGKALPSSALVRFSSGSVDSSLESARASVQNELQQSKMWFGPVSLNLHSKSREVALPDKSLQVSKWKGRLVWEAPHSEVRISSNPV